MLDDGVRAARQIGHVGWLTCEEEEIQALIQKDPKMCPQRSEIGFSASASWVNCSRHMLQFSWSLERSFSWICGSAFRNLLIEGNRGRVLEKLSSVGWFISILRDRVRISASNAAHCFLFLRPSTVNADIN